MNLNETKELLALITSYDRRPFSAEAVDVWYAELRAVDLEDAAEAVKTIFRTNGHDDRGNIRTLLPADVRRPAQAIADTRRRKLARRALTGPPREPGLTPAARAALAAMRADAARAADRYREGLAVA